MGVDWSLHYDRSVSEAFLSYFKTGKPLRLLVDLANNAPYPVDLQFRHDPKTGSQHASLYVGLTDVLKVRVTGSGVVRLSAHPTWSAQQGANGRHYGFKERWVAGVDVGEWPAVEDYLEKVLPIAAATHGHVEGAVQAAVSTFASSDFIVLDREAALHFRDSATKATVMAEVVDPIIAALSGLSGVKGTPKTSFGGKCDLLALDRAGNLLTIEIKPRNVSTIRWAAAQATVYGRLFERWLTSSGSARSPADILRRQWEQRATTGLTERRPDKRLDLLGKVVPVVVVQRGTRQSLLEEFTRVQRRLVDRGVGFDELRVYEAGMSGRLSSFVP